jgi:hypothetical protein
VVKSHPDLRLGIISTDRYLLPYSSVMAPALIARAMLLIVFPVVISISFLLIADIDSPRAGLIRSNKTEV